MIPYHIIQCLSVTLFREKIKQCSNLLHHYIIDHRYDDDDNDDDDDDHDEDNAAGLSDFTLLKLRHIADQRSLYSSVDDIVYAGDSDSDFDEPFDLAVPRQKYCQIVKRSNMQPMHM